MPTDFYCGVVPADVWPFGEPLVVEVEVERSAYLIADVHISATLPGLARYLRRRLRGLPITELRSLTCSSPQGTYHADYWKWITAALTFALKAFEEDENRVSDYFASLLHTRHARHGIAILAGKESA